MLLSKTTSCGCCSSSKGSELISKEEAKTGRVHLSILVAYFKACTLTMTFITLFLLIFIYVPSVGGNFWLATWSNAEERALGENFTQVTACDGFNDISM